MRLLLFFAVCICRTFCFEDVVFSTIKRLENVQNNTEACDNFYRHACPLDFPHLFINMEHEVAALADDIAITPFSNFEILTDFAPLETSLDLYSFKLSENFTSEKIVKIYYDKCESGQGNDNLLMYLEKVMTKLRGKYEESCSGGGSFCASQLKYEHNCTRGAVELLYALGRLERGYFPSPYIDVEYNITRLVTYAQYFLRFNYQAVVGARLMQTNERIKSGAEKTLEILHGLKTILIDWIVQTKWVTRASAEEYVGNIVNKISLPLDFENLQKDYPKTLKSAEEYYIGCKRDFKSEDSNEKAICLLYAYAKANIVRFRSLAPEIFSRNAYNSHPFLSFGFPWYLAANNSLTEAGLIGFLGFAMGHEISHSVIEDFSPINSHRISFFSKNSTECIQKTYENTCNEFKETSCEVAQNQVDENGSDILGVQLAYQYLKQRMGDRIYETYQPLNKTYEQIFFYATSILFCHPTPSEQKIGDPHSTRNIRVNVFAQHPEFRNAFKCADDSRMVKVNPEQCQIYGPNAPEVKRHRLGWF